MTELNQWNQAKLTRSHNSSHWLSCSESLPYAYSMRGLPGHCWQTANYDHFQSDFSSVTSAVCRPFAACRRHSVINYWSLALVKVADGEIARLNTNDIKGDLDTALARFSLKWIFDDVSMASSTSEHSSLSMTEIFQFILTLWAFLSWVHSMHPGGRGCSSCGLPTSLP